MINWDKYDKRLVGLVKLKDLVFENGHPGGVNEGYTSKGYIDLIETKKHNCLFIQDHSRWFHTSIVVKQIECDGYDLLQTLNSVYKIEFIK